MKAIEDEYRKMGFLEESESFEEKHPEALTAGDEKFSWSGEKYCYEKHKNKESVFVQKVQGPTL